MTEKEFDKNVKKFESKAHKKLLNNIKDIFKTEIAYGQRYKKMKKVSLAILILSLILMLLKLEFFIPFYYFNLYFTLEIWNLLFIFGTILFSISYIFLTVYTSTASALRITHFNSYINSKIQSLVKKFRDTLLKEVDGFTEEIDKLVFREKDKDKKKRRYKIYTKYMEDISKGMSEDKFKKVYGLFKSLLKELKKI